MKKIFKYAYVALAGVLTLAASSCTDDYEYDAPATPQGMQVYFSNTLPSQYDLSETDSTHFLIPVSRVKTDDAATVNLAFTDTTNTFTAPSTVSFAAGDSVAYLPVSYSPSKMAYDDYKTVTVTILDSGTTTPYGNATYIFSAAKASPYISLGNNGIYQDAFIMSNAYYVDIRQHRDDPSLFRVMAPYDGAARSEYGTSADGNQTPFIQLKVLHKGDTFHNQTIETDGLVYFDGFNTGFYNTANDYNKDILVYHPGAFTNYQNQSYWQHNYVVAWQDNGLPGEIQLAPYYYMDGIGGWNQTQKDGYITILFPGFTPSDYSSSAEYQGRFINTEDSCAAQFNISLGSDVNSAKVALVSNDAWTANAQSIINGIDNDSIASTTITSSGTYSFNYTETGKYVLVIITYDAEGTAQSYYYTDPIQLNNATDGQETFADIAAGTLTIGVSDLSSNFSQNAWGLLFGQAITQEAVLAQSSADATRFRLTPFLTEDYPLYFTVDADGTIVVDQNDVYNNNGSMIQATDIVTWYMAVGQQDLSQYFASTYDASKGLYTFNLSYTGPGYDGNYALEQETFQVSATEAKAVNAALKAAKKVAAKKVSAKKHSLKLVGNDIHFVPIRK